MTCVTIQSLLFDYCCGQLSEQTELKIKGHLDECPRCSLINDSFAIFSASKKIKLWFNKYRKPAAKSLACQP